MNIKEQRASNVFDAVRRMDRVQGESTEEIGRFLFHSQNPLKLPQIEEGLKNLIESELIVECVPYFKTLPKTPKRYKVWYNKRWNKNEHL